MFGQDAAFLVRFSVRLMHQLAGTAFLWLAILIAGLQIEIVQILVQQTARLEAGQAVHELIALTDQRVVQKMVRRRRLLVVGQLLASA